MRTRAYAVALLIAFSPVALPVQTAFAQDAMTEMARQRFQEGVKAYDKGKFEEARASFLQAYALKRHPAVLLNLAQSELKSNHPVDAARHFSTYLHENTTATALEKADAEKGLADARAKCGHIQVSVNATGADVFVDGELVGRSPLAEPVDVGAGNHTVEAKLNGHSASKTVAAAIGKTAAIDLAVEGAGAPVVAVLPAPGGAPSNATTAAGPAPALPGEQPGTEPPPGSNAAPSADVMQLSTSNREGVLPWLAHNKLAWVGLGVTAVGVGMGVGFGLASKSAGSKADDLAGQIKSRWADDPGAIGQRPQGNVCAGPVVVAKYNYAGPCSALQDNLNQQDNDKKLATVGWVVAGVGAVGTVGLYFLTSKKPAEAASVPVLVPIVAPQTAGLSLSGQF